MIPAVIGSSWREVWSSAGIDACSSISNAGTEEMEENDPGIVMGVGGRKYSLHFVSRGFSSFGGTNQLEGQVAIGGHTQRNVRVVAQIQRMTRTFPRVHEETALCVTNGDSAERQFRRGFRLRTKRHLEGRVTAEQKYRQFPPNRTSA